MYISKITGRFLLTQQRRLQLKNSPTSRELYTTGNMMSHFPTNPVRDAIRVVKDETRSNLHLGTKNAVFHSKLIQKELVSFHTSAPAFTVMMTNAHWLQSTNTKYHIHRPHHIEGSLTVAWDTYPAAISDTGRSARRTREAPLIKQTRQLLPPID